ncbi:MAG TPA: glycosyltransferase [bacterium]|nr:glycosyltransferase [bacterium]
MADPAPRLRRTLFLAESFPPSPGGASRSLGALVARFPAGAGVVSTPHRAGCGRVDRTMSVPVRRARTFVGPSGIGLRLWRTQVEWLVRRDSPRTLVICGSGADGRLGLELHESHDLPFLVMADAPEIAALRAGAEAGAQPARDLVDRASAMVVPTRTAWLEAYKLHTRPHDLELIPAAVDLQSFRPGTADAGLRKKLQAGRGPVVLTVNDGDPAFDAETVLQAFAALRGSLRRAVLVAVGLREPRHRSLAKKLKVDRGVRFLDAPPSELPDLYRAADLFLTAHLGGRDAPIQGAGHVLAEALASGLPVLGTRTPATSDVVDEDECGLLVEPGAHAKLGKVAADLLRDDEKRGAMGAAAREAAEEHHDAARCAERLHTLLEVLLIRRLRREPAGPTGAHLPAA